MNLGPAGTILPTTGKRTANKRSLLSWKEMKPESKLFCRQLFWSRPQFLAGRPSAQGCGWWAAATRLHPGKGDYFVLGPEHFDF